MEEGYRGQYIDFKLNILLNLATNQHKNCSTYFGGYKIEMGAQYVHGVEGNVAYELAEEADLIEPPDEKDEEVLLE